MLTKIKNYLAKRKQIKAENFKLKQMKKYYETLKNGAVFLQFIRQDIEKMKKTNYNRAQRRRFEKSLYEKGSFSEEIITHYEGQVDKILNYLAKQEENKKKNNFISKLKNKFKKPVDGAKYYEELKKKEKEGKI